MFNTGRKIGSTLAANLTLPSLALVVFATVGIAGATIPAAAEDDIVIGLTTPLTGSVAALGQQELWGVSFAIDKANEAGGIKGRMLKLEAQDNQCNPSLGITSVEHLLEKNPIAIIGAMCSSVTLAIMPQLQRAERPLVVATSTSPLITEQAGVGGNEWVFRTNPSDKELGVALSNYLIKEGKIKTIAFVGEDNDYGRGGFTALSEALKGKGVEIISSDFYQIGTPDFTTILTRISHRYWKTREQRKIAACSREMSFGRAPRNSSPVQMNFCFFRLYRILDDKHHRHPPIQNVCICYCRPATPSRSKIKPWVPEHHLEGDALTDLGGPGSKHRVAVHPIAT